MQAGLRPVCIIVEVVVADQGTLPHPHACDAGIEESLSEHQPHRFTVPALESRQGVHFQKSATLPQADCLKRAGLYGAGSKIGSSPVTRSAIK